VARAADALGFQPLTLEDGRAWERAVGGDLAPYSDFNFISLWAWNVADRTAIAWIPGGVALKLCRSQE
jgi:hypothetical protein